MGQLKPKCLKFLQNVHSFRKYGVAMGLFIWKKA